MTNGRYHSRGTGRSVCWPTAISSRPLVSAAQLDDVLRRRALLALHDIELNPLTLGERLEAAPLNGRMMDEAILLTILAGDEAETLRVVEPLHGAGRTHCGTPRCCVVGVREYRRADYVCS